MALDYIKRAKWCLEEAERALSAENYPMAVRRSQECVQMSLKAVLRAYGVEYPRRHDVGDALEAITDRVPTWFADRVAWLKEVSRDLAEKRGPAMYGYEAELVPPSELFDAADAQEAVSAAKEVLTLCSRLLEELFGEG